MRYARIAANAVAEIRNFGVIPDPNPNKGLDWRECPSGLVPGVDPETEVLEAPSYEIEPELVTETWTKRNLTAQELDDRKVVKVGELGDFRTEILSLLFAIEFAQQNEIRVLQGLSPIPSTANGAETFLNAANALPRLSGVKLTDLLKDLL